MRRILPLLIALPLAAAELPERLQTLLADSPLAQRGHIGIQVALAETGEVLFEYNSNKSLTPASNTKLFSSALALLRLGPGYRYTTTLRASTAPDASGRIAGSLALIGSGDPTLSGREYPFRQGSPAGDPLAVIAWFADQLAAKGVTRIDGDIVGDDSAYTWEPYPDGWSADDVTGESGAPVSALTIGDNVVTVLIRPGDPARLTQLPPIEYFQLDNRIRESNTSRIVAERDLNSHTIRFTGTLSPKGSDARRFAVDDPALFAALALKRALTERGIDVRGEARARHSFRGQPTPAFAGFDLVERTSLPLIETLRIVNKVSQNLHAELILREVGRVRGREGSTAAGLTELRWLLTGAGIETADVSLHDGSGMSRLNLVTPAAVVKLLTYMYRSERRDDYLSTLGIAGEDGTVARRMQRTPAQTRIRAKTGTLSHISALSGYILPALEGDRVLAFSIVSNSQIAPAAEVRAFVDKLAVAILE